MGNDKKGRKPLIGLILSGGGSRAAYQVGVLKAISELLPKESPNPFQVLSGTSAGAINAAAVAIYAHNFHEAVLRLVRVWHNFRSHQVFRSDAIGVMTNATKWLAALMLGGLGKHNPVALLDRTPLQELLGRYLPFDRINDSLEKGYLHAIGITASGYTSGHSVTFFQGVETLQAWHRARRIGCRSEIKLEHLMASSAIPFLFGAERIHREFFGDGTMRQSAPISPALHLGAERVLVIGVRHANETETKREKTWHYPSLAQIAGHVLNSIFLDSLEADLERLQRINKTIGLIPEKKLREGNVTLRQVECFTISPSEEINDISHRYVDSLPTPIRFLLRGIGGLSKSGSNLASYLLFEQGFCRELINLGYKDTLARREELGKFLGLSTEKNIIK